MCFRARPELLGTVAWGTRVGLEPGRFVPLPRDFRGWPILALERLNRDFSEWRHRTAPKLEFSEFSPGDDSYSKGMKSL